MRVGQGEEGGGVGAVTWLPFSALGNSALSEGGGAGPDKSDGLQWVPRSGSWHQVPYSGLVCKFLVISVGNRSAEHSVDYSPGATAGGMMDMMDPFFYEICPGARHTDTDVSPFSWAPSFRFRILMKGHCGEVAFGMSRPLAWAGSPLQCAGAGSSFRVTRPGSRCQLWRLGVCRRGRLPDPAHENVCSVGRTLGIAERPSGQSSLSGPP